MHRRPPRGPAARHAVAAVLLVALSACSGAPQAATSATPVVEPDAGAAAREAALARLGGDDPLTAVTPDVVGLPAAAAQDLLAGLGLAVHLVAFDPQQPVTVQWPAAGQPVPLDAVVEAWLGVPDEEVAEAAPAEAAPPTSPDPVDDGGQPETPATATPSPSPAAALASDGAQDVVVTHVLPPHTDGRLRTNPRGLPALPMGTELTGTASWYGPGFHGLQTACGGIYDQNGATIAARELRCGTVVRITGPTGLTVEATVTDWGPAEWTGRRFDLSAAVFNAIAPLGAGVVPVRLVTTNVPR